MIRSEKNGVTENVNCEKSLKTRANMMSRFKITNKYCKLCCLSLKIACFRDSQIFLQIS